MVDPLEPMEPLGPIERALLARIAAGDGDAAGVLADFWISHGDAARGRFVHVERALAERPRDRGLLAARRDLLRRHRRRWRAPALAAGFPLDELGFASGFLATPLVLAADEPADELRRLSPVIYRDHGPSGCSYYHVHAARRSTAERDNGDDVLLKACDFGAEQYARCHADELADPRPANRLVMRGHAVLHGDAARPGGRALVLPGGTDVASVVGVRNLNDPPRERRPGAALGVAFAASVAREACRALAPLHAGGQRHGQLTPENILLDAAGGATIVSLYPDDRIFDTFMPWAHERMWHCSPEMTRGDRTDARADVFALGLVMATLVGGRHPALGGSDFDAAVALRHRRLALPELPRALAAVLRRALGNLAERYPDAIAFGDALDAAARADGVACGPEVIVEILGEPTDPRRRT